MLTSVLDVMKANQEQPSTATNDGEGYFIFNVLKPPQIDRFAVNLNVLMH